jgi:hypothetical protein
VAAGDEDCLLFTAAEVIDRIERHGDLFTPLLHEQQSLPPL